LHLYQQRFKLRVWIRARLWAQVLAGMALGLIVGAVLGPDTEWLAPDTSEVLGAWLALPGQIFLGLIAMVLIPLIFASIVGGLNGARSGDELRAIGLRLAAFVLATTFVAAWIGVLLASWLKPGVGVTGAAGAQAQRAPANETAFVGSEAPQIIADLLPTNPTASIVQVDLLAIVVLSVLVGIAATQVPREKIAPFLNLLDALLSISMTIVKWAMFLAPLAVFGLMAQLVMRVGLDTIVGISTYLFTVLLGLLILLTLYLAILAGLGRVGPIRYFRVSGETLLVAFSTSSSSAVMPMTIKSARALAVPSGLANIVVPLGATMNMAGTALYQSVAVLFLAQMAGIELSLSQIGLVTATLVASSIGAPGIPGVSVAILISVAAGFGIPPDGMVIILGVDRLLDMSRTTVNVTGDLTAAVVLHRLLPSRAPSKAD
jgi:Na+/H+-dicarboxylate symporter